MNGISHVHMNLREDLNIISITHKRPETGDVWRWEEKERERHVCE